MIPIPKNILKLLRVRFQIFTESIWICKSLTEPFLLLQRTKTNKTVLKLMAEPFVTELR